MIKNTNLEIENFDFDNIELHEMDTEEFHFNSKTFDAVLCGYSLMFYILNFEKTLSENNRF
jgi:ubiquinone/menaquinone biosynthesis C-methylase UbiE